MDDYRNSYNGSGTLGSLVAGGSATGSIETNGDIDVFGINLVAGRTYTFKLRGSPSGGGTLSDTYLQLSDANGGYLSGSSSFNGSPDGQITFTARTTSIFYLSAQGEYNSLIGSYTLEADSGYVDDYRDRYDDTIEALGAIAAGGTATGNIEIGGDLDVFRIDLVAGRTYTFNMRAAPGGGGTLSDGYLQLFNATGGYLTANSSGNGTTDPQFTFTARDTGVYYLSAQGEYSTHTGSYTLAADAGYVDDYRDRYDDTIEALGAIAAGGTATGAIEIGGDLDVFRVDLVAGRTYTFDMRGSPTGGGTLSDSYLQLFNGTGGYLAANSSSNGTTDAQFTFTARTTGIYYLSAQGEYSTHTGSYTLGVNGGYVDDFRDRYDDTIEALGAIAAGGTATGNIEIGGDLDVFRIDLVAGRTYTFDMRGSPTGGGTLADSYLQLFNADGGYLAANSSSNGTTDAQFTYTATRTGVFYLSAQGEYSSLTGTYTLSTTSGLVDDYRDTYNDTNEALGAVTAGGAANGHIEEAGDVDYFAVELVAGRTYAFDLSGAPGGGTLSNPNLQLRGADGSWLAENGDFNGGTDSRILYTATRSGTYYLAAGGQSATIAGTYTLSADTGYVDDYRDVYNQTVEALGAITPGGTATGTLEAGGDADVFAISLAAGETYTFDLRGAASGGTLTDPYLELRNAAGNWIAENGNFNGGTDSRLTFTATDAGVYYLVAKGQSGDLTGSYTLSASGGTGGGDDYRDTWNDTSEVLGSVAIGGTRTGNIEAAGDVDIIAVRLVAGQNYTFDLGRSTLANGELRLLNGAGVVIRSNDDFNGVNSRILFTAAVTGTYYLDARSHLAEGTGTYFVRARANFDDGRDSIGDTSVAATTLAFGREYLGNIEASGDVDIVSVSLIAGRTYTFDLIGSAVGGSAMSNVVLRLLNGAGAILFTNTDFNGVNSRIVFTAAVTETYYLDARSQITGGTGTYSVLARSAFDDGRDSVTDTSVDAINIDIGWTRLGAIEANGDIDIFAIQLTAGRTYTFDLTGTTAAGTALANTTLRLLSASGAILHTNTDFNGVDSRIVFTATATDTYYLDARSQLAGGRGAYSVTVRGAFDDGRDAVNDTSVVSTSLVFGETRLAAIEASGDIDVFAVQLTAGRSYTFDLAGSTAAGIALANPVLRLLNSAGTVLFTNTDFNGVSSRLVFTATTTATYYLDARSQLTNGLGVYSIVARAGDDDTRDTIGDLASPARNLAVGGAWLGHVETAGDTDVYGVSLVAGQTYQFRLAGSAVAAGALGNGDLQLLDASGMQLAYNGAGDATSTGLIQFVAETSGIHYLNVRGAGMSTGTYAVNVLNLGDDYRDSIGDTSQAMGAVSAGGFLNGKIEAAGDSDIAAVTLTAGRTYVFSVLGGPGRLADGDLQLLNAGGTLLAYNDDANGSADPQITFGPRTTGTFYLNVRGIEDNVGSYTIRAANKLSGGAAAESLTGTNGADNIHSGGGNDSIRGGGSADWIFFDTALSATNVDQLLDFSAAQDTIMLNRTIFTGFGAHGVIAPGAFVAGRAATGADDRILYDRASGEIFYDGDGSGAGAAILFAQVAVGTALTNADFQVIIG